MSVLRLPLLIFFVLIFNSGFCQHPNVSKSPEPHWIQKTQPDLEAVQPADEASGFYYLLIDNQDFLGTEEYYRRYTYRISTTKGVQDMADLSIDFDPEYQKVALHQIRIIREGKVLDKLDPDQLQVVQRESNMERHLYDGRLTVIANLSDVRVGDILDYSYTITGDNPIHEGRYQKNFFLQFAIPIERHNYIINVPGNEKIYYKTLNGGEDPEITVTDGFTRYSWISEKSEPIFYESNTPAWYDPAPLVEVTQFDSWEEVVGTYRKHYNLDPESRSMLGTRANELVNSTDSDSGFIREAIRFVQDEVRYLGFENGLNSHKPSDPVEVLERRFGDCKDKSFLLSEMLQARGIKAYPMLVHSYNGKNLIESLPSPNLFDHCVVQIDMGNNEYRYLDPTISEQGGTINNLYFPDYRYGLVLKRGEKDLQKLPLAQTPKTRITESFDLDGIGGGSNLHVETIYRGSNADFQRREFAQSSRQSIQQSYTSFYSNMYPGISATKTLRSRDYRERNEFIVYEHYRIDSLWLKNQEQQQIISAEFYPLSLQDFLFPEKASEREMPYYLDQETNVEHRTVVNLPEEWPIFNESSSYGSEAFKYDYDIQYQNRKLEITHKYENLKDHVSPEDLSSYLAQHEAAQQELTYSLTYDKSYEDIAAVGSTSWLAVLLSFLIMAATAFLCFLIYRNYDIPSEVSSRNERMIGGWLILVAIGVSLTPFVLLVQLFSAEGFFDASTWSVLFSSSENIGLGILVFFELIYNSAYLVFSVFLLILFFQRRSILPKLIIWLFAVTLVVTSLDTFASLQLSPEPFTGPEKQEMFTSILRSAIQCLIWIPYFIYSQRVAETFTKNRKKKVKEEEIQSQPVFTPPDLPVVQK